MNPTIQDVIDTVLREIPGAPFDESVDTFKIGNPSLEVAGIVTTFLASYDVIRRAIELGANLIITHEPIYYNHLDEVDWLTNDSVYHAKRKLLEENNITVWRFHDYWHLHRPDGILAGFIKELGWESYAAADNPIIYHVPPVPLWELATFLKAVLDINTVRIVGNLEMMCQRVGLLLGAIGGRPQINFLAQQEVDVLVCGEIDEWETSEYVRDAVAQGEEKALIILGHANSEEPGMKWLVEWLGGHFPDIAITHVPAGDPFHFV